MRIHPGFEHKLRERDRELAWPTPCRFSESLPRWQIFDLLGLCGEATKTVYRWTWGLSSFMEKLLSGDGILTRRVGNVRLVFVMSGSSSLVSVFVVIRSPSNFLGH